MNKGTLKAISIQTYGIFFGKKVLKKFEVKDPKVRRKIDSLQGQEVDFKKDIVPLLE